MLNKKLCELTNPQRSIWNIEQFYNNSNINNIVGCLKIEKNADFKALEKALNLFILKNDSFRTKFTLKKNKPLQYFDDFVYESVEILDLKNENELLKFEETFPLQNIDVLNGFLFIPKLLRFPDGQGILVLSTHHLISDAWTMSLCLKDIYDNYVKIINHEKISKELQPSYGDFISSQEEYTQSEKFLKDKEFWDMKFKTLPNIISFKSTIQTSLSANRKIYTFEDTLVKKIKAFCKKQSISDYVFLLSIFSVYLNHIFKFNNFVIGNPILNRSNFKEKHMTGMFVSTMPFVVDISDNDSFLNLCQKISSDQKQLYRHLRFPYSDILNNIRNSHKFNGNLYDIIFSYQNEAIPSFCKWLPNHSQLESLQIHIKNLSEDTSNLSIHYDYLIDVFSEEQIDLMHSRIVNLINSVLLNSDILVSSLEIISKEETNKLLNTFNDTKANYNKNSNIVTEFEKIVQKYPNNIAIIDKNNSLTYKELNDKANFLANEISNLNIDTQIIAFSLERTSNIIVTILGILKSGHTYMPIDPDYPIDRVNFMLMNSTSKLLISTNNFYQKVNFSNQYLNFDKLKFDKIYNNINIHIPSSQKAYIMYTSGSTGTPKAVTIKHYNVLNFANSMHHKLNYKQDKNNTNVLSVTTVCFDIFVFEVFPTLLSGLCLIMADENQTKNPKLLSELIKKYNISKILTTPSRVELLFQKDSYLESISCIKEFILGGEPLPKSLLSRLQAHTHSKIYNLYGPTETTVYSSFKDVTDSNLITIGSPIDNTQFYVLDEKNKLQPIGMIGELCIGGDGVGDGYFNNPEKTESVFIQNPFIPNTIIYKTGDLGFWQPNGELICLGRKDHQIKIRGYRIELDDISENILTYNNIEKCIVVDKEDLNGTKFLCAYFVSKTEIDVTALRKYLLDLLPNYMIPNFFIKMEQLPLTINHKIDRKSLPSPDFSRESLSLEYVEPTSIIEKNLCTLFKNSLNINKIGVTNDIFDYGIDSLELINIQTNMLDLGYKVNTQDFYKYRTIQSISNFIENIDKQSQNIDSIDSNYLSTVNNSFYKHIDSLNFSKNSFKNILITGASGYLGIHILENMLKNTNATIYCLIRSKKNESALERLKRLYKIYFNKDLDTHRIFVISSDITKPYFGLNKNQYDELLNSIDLFLNVAANVKYYGNYADFKKINVDVVDNAIQFCITKNIQLVHVSTLGVSGNYLVNHDKNYCSFSENDFYIGQNYYENVYIQTKFEAEKLIYSKIKDGLNASIFRVGNLTGRYTDGAFQQNIEDNAFYNILRIILKYDIIPNTMVNEFLEFTPVDFCANAIRLLIFNVNINKTVFHMFNNNYISVSELLNTFNKLGFNVNVLSGNDFKKELLSLTHKNPNENILKGVINDLDDVLGLSFSSTVNQQNTFTNSYLESLNFNWPKIEKTYIQKIVNYMINNNYI